MDPVKIAAIGLLAGVCAMPALGDEQPDVKPLVLGYGKKAFSIGKELYSSDFNDRQNWILQIQKLPDSPLRDRVKIQNGIMDIYVPKRGCTAWLNKKFSGPLTIIYQVRCPVETRNDEGIMPTDINNFWHCSDPREFDAVLKSTETHYNGDFVSYHEMHGYYASTGGGRNRTTRFRRYPRWLDGKDIPHLALNHNDGKPEFLITPGKWHTIQLVVCNGILQYIKDGKVVYEIKEGDTIKVESRLEGKRGKKDETYTLKTFPAYGEGYFGFRMVATHHQYSNVKIFELEPR